MTVVHEFKRNNLYRIDTADGEAFAVAVQIDDDELLELCRIIVDIERHGKTILNVRVVHAVGLDEVEYRNTKEYARARQEPTHNVVDGKFKIFCSSGAFFVSPCKVDLNSYRVYAAGFGGEWSEDDDVTEYGVSYTRNDREEFFHVYNLSDEDSEDFSPDGTVLDTLKHIRDGGKVLHYGFWCCDDDSVVTLDDAIRFVERRFMLNYLRYAPSIVLSDFMGSELLSNMFQFELEQHLTEKIDHMEPDEFDEMYSEWETKTDNFSTYRFESKNDNTQEV